MIKASVMYPNQDGAVFDHDYYREKHVPMIKELMGDAVVKCSIDKGFSGGPGVPAPYVCMGHIYCNTIDDFRAAFGKNNDALAADIPNFTNLKPVMQISEVISE